MRFPSGLLLVAALAILAAGCGSETSYAGLTQHNAELNAYEAFQQALVEPSSSLRGKHMVLVGVREDAAPDGHEAWLALFRSQSNSEERYCIWVAATTATPGADIRPCTVHFAGEEDPRPA